MRIKHLNSKLGLIGFLLTLLGPLFLSKFHLDYFAPYLVFSYYKYSRAGVLWRAYGCGIIIDLFSTTPIFGLTAINYCLVTLLLYGQNRNFFEDKPSTLPLMTALFSVSSTLLSVILALFIGQKVHPSFKWIFFDLLLFPIFNALYAGLISFQFSSFFRKVRV